MIKASTRFGSVEVTVEAGDEKELFQRLGFFSFLPHQCGNCKSGNITPAHRKVQDFDFYSLRCNDCGKELRFGQTKVGQHLFPKRDQGWVDPFSRGGTDEPDFD